MDFQHKVTSAISATGDTSVAVIENKVGYTKLCFHAGVATQALDNFDLFIKAHEDATARDVTPANWASLAATDYPGIKYSSGNLAALAAAANGYFEMDITGLAEVEIKVSAAVTGAAVTARWSLS
jgi:hypothetical protein